MLITITFDIPDEPGLLDIIVKAASELGFAHARRYRMAVVEVTETHELSDLAATLHKYALEVG